MDAHVGVHTHISPTHPHPPTPSDVFVEEMHGRAAEARAKEERRAKRAADDFATMLRRHRAVHADMTWEDGCGALSGEPEWGAVHDEKQRRVLFEEAIGRLQAKRSKRKVPSLCG